MVTEKIEMFGILNCDKVAPELQNFVDSLPSRYSSLAKLTGHKQAIETIFD
eukprot:CAMPEP_0174265578 /NCGR_PEP_ID=MMETSP0439-20130205/27053_1 /TAXON_ID=0 /ORGANISM="Stereomyxa ramosa, Strain Chinc5" /LENGTH=50 /DNA_ID=CAMNT_0015352113 /DNA_START=570 /DNA_END=719 /DNA_ORIENTATION=+